MGRLPADSEWATGPPDEAMQDVFNEVNATGERSNATQARGSDQPEPQFAITHFHQLQPGTQSSLG